MFVFWSVTRGSGCFHSSCWLIKRSRSTCDLLAVCSHPTLWVKASSSDPGPVSVDPAELSERVWSWAQIRGSSLFLRKKQASDCVAQRSPPAGCLQRSVAHLQRDDVYWVEICCWSETVWAAYGSLPEDALWDICSWCLSAWTESSCRSMWCSFWLVLVWYWLCWFTHTVTLFTSKAWMMGWRW